MKVSKIWLFALIVFMSCGEDPAIVEDSNTEELTIFFVNDQHGQLDNFAKIKHIIDQEKKETNVLVACSGDIFSGNPVVDNHPQQGLPIIDVMNQVGFDISVLGNHEFDYGPEALKNRMNQANFDWVCANLNVSSSGIPQPPPYKTLEVGKLKITFLGLVETNGKRGATIPLTHPWRVRDMIFDRPENVLNQYADLKEQEDADLLIALTHLGHTAGGGALGDFQLAQRFPYFDLIIGGHSNQLLNELINNIPVYQAGSHLRHLGKIKLTVRDKSVISRSYELIDLASFQEIDNDLKAIIDNYNTSMPELDDIIGYSHQDHDRSEVGCFYTDAVRSHLKADITFQNSGGIRSDLDEGDITRREIFEIDPFNNGTINYTMSVDEIKNFLMGTGAGFYYSGVLLDQSGQNIVISDLDGNELNGSDQLVVGINDYTPAIFDQFFPDEGITSSLTTAEAIISYLEDTNDQVDYPECTYFFRYQ